MISFVVSGLVLDGPDTELMGLSDIKLVQVDGAWVIVVASEADSSLTTFGFESGVITSVLDTVSYSSQSGTRTVWDLTTALVDGQTFLLPATRYENQAVVYQLGATAALGNGFAQTDVSGLGRTHAVSLGSSVFVFAQSANGLTRYELVPTRTLVELGQITDTATTFLGDVSAMASADVGGSQYLFVASAYDTGASSYQVGSAGGLTFADSVEPGDFSGFYLPQALLAVEAGGQDYLVMASSGSSSLTVYRVGANGSLTETDHLLDTLDTRFEGASLVESFVYDGRSFIVAAGRDDGLTILELKPTGQLWEHVSLADTYDTTLDNISGLAVEVIGGKVEILVSSPTDHGFTHLTLDMSGLDTEISGSENADNLRGTSGADVIYGRAGDDTITGRGGADIIVDGLGEDRLTGNGGRDVFQFVEDNTIDYILDYSVGYDVIDLSAYNGVYSLNDIEIVQFCDGVYVLVNEDLIMMENTASKEYLADSFGISDFLF